MVVCLTLFSGYYAFEFSFNVLTIVPKVFLIFSYVKEFRLIKIFFVCFLISVIDQDEEELIQLALANDAMQLFAHSWLQLGISKKTMNMENMIEQASIVISFMVFFTTLRFTSTTIQINFWKEL